MTCESRLVILTMIYFLTLKLSESPSAPGVPIVYRLPEEKAANPDRLNLDRRRLTICPILEGEENLRLLNFQHNSIARIQHLSSLRRLIFLDLYDNRIEEISGLSTLSSLRVLMLGKNRISKIENLNNLLKLDVLDLHGNQIKELENLNHLSELRVLNLAGNQLTKACNFLGLSSLTELNLRRNKIQYVGELDHLPKLLRLFLSYNDVRSFESIRCLGGSQSLQVTLFTFFNFFLGLFCLFNYDIRKNCGHFTPFSLPRL